MGAEAYYQISLIAAFIAGMVALFAPCCFTYLFPAYLGNIFRERKQVLLMTLIYSLGIFVVMLPVVLGAKALSSIFFRLHDQTYLFGGIFMLIVAFLALLGVKLPMPKLSMNQKRGVSDPISTFTLGVFSGITSACCAPVLLGVITLSALSPTTFQALGVGAVYVLGMVTPLFLAATLIHDRNILENPILKKRITDVKVAGKEYPIFVSNIVAFVIFSVTAIAMLALNAAGKLGMPTGEATITKSINAVALRVTTLTGNTPLINILFVAFIIYVLFKFIKKVIKLANSK